MPKVRLNFDIRGWITQTVEVPQAVIDEYNLETAKAEFDERALDRLLEPYINYDNILDQLEYAEDIELSTIKSEATELVD